MASIRDALFEEDLGRVKESLYEMAELVSEALRKAIFAFKEKNGDLARDVIEEDDRIDLKEVEIEEKCLRIMALRYPIKDSLREVFTILKIITDLERMGDEASNIAQFTLRVIERPVSQFITKILLIAEVCDEMLKNSVRAFIERNASLAEEAFKKDEVVDDLYRQVFSEVLSSMVSDKELTKSITGILFIARFLERFGDHASNIAERVYYMVTGKRIKVELGMRKGGMNIE